MSIRENLPFAPRFYTRVEGEGWLPWPNGNWHPADFHQFKQRSARAVVINYIQVHSVAFDDPALGYGNFLRWDCINGFNN